MTKGGITMITMTSSINPRRAAGLLLLAVGLAAILALGLVDSALAQGSDAGKNAGDLLKKWGTELYTGVLAIIAIIFLINRRYQELGIFVGAAMVVGWMIFSPDSVANAGRDILTGIFGG